MRAGVFGRGAENMLSKALASILRRATLKNYLFPGMTGLLHQRRTNLAAVKVDGNLSGNRGGGQAMGVSSPLK